MVWVSGLTCPVCAGTFGPDLADMTPHAPPRSPRPGDIGLCDRCFNWVIVALLRTDLAKSDDASALTLRALSNSEWIRLTDDRRRELTHCREAAMCVGGAREKAPV